MRKKIDLGVVAPENVYPWLKGTTQTCPVEIEIALEEKDGKGPVFTAVGTVWRGPKKVGIHHGGQCIDEIASLFPKDKKVQLIHEIWKRWHLNDLRAGTPKQLKYLEGWRKANGVTGWDYDEACAALKEADLYEDEGVKYGHQWLYEPIPDDVLAIIKSWFEE